MAKKTKARSKGENQVLTAKEVADWLRIPKSTIYKLCSEGRIPAKKIGRHWRFDRVTLEEWLVEQEIDAAREEEAQHP